MADMVVTLFALTFGIVLGVVSADPDLLQDVCVADLTSGDPIFLFFFHFLGTVKQARFKLASLYCVRTLNY